MLAGHLSQEVRARASAAGVDWRNAYLVFEGGELLAFPAAAAEQMDARPLEVQGLMTVSSASEPLRREPSHRSELVSELRGGEWLSRILVRDDWSLVQGEDGYVGWLANWALIEQSEDQRTNQLERRLGHYPHPLGTLWASDHWAEAPLWLGTPLLEPVDGARARGGQRLVELPTGETGWIEEGDLHATDARDASSIALDTARALLGTPYRWGGRTPTSLDCSGLVQLCFERAGIRLPRDSAQQQHCGEEVGQERAAWAAGDLLFFGDPADHVGIYDGREGMLHCRGKVRRDVLEAIAELMKRCSAVRRVGTLTGPSTLWYLPRAAS